MTHPEVSVVIPTTLKRDIAGSLRTAREQDAVRSEVILVVDRPPTTEIPDNVRDLCDKVLFTGGGRGAAAARNIGVANSDGSWIAYLDDDDYWHVGKLRTQLSAVSAAGRPSDQVVGTRALQTHASGGSPTGPVPARPYVDTENLSDYLFFRRGPRVGRNVIFLPSLLVSKALAQELPWDESLPRHQDWDWLLRAAAAGASLHQLPDVLLTVTVGSPGSISAQVDWRSSLTWAQGHRALMTTRAYSDFLVGQTLRFALGARSAAGVAAVRAELRGLPRPSVQALALGMTGTVPRAHLERAAFSLTKALTTKTSRRREDPTTFV